MKKEKGVTLIALIITIIVMLILVVVTINIATSGDMVNKAGEAKTKTQAATQNELNQMNTTAIGIDEAVAGGKITHINPDPDLPIVDESTSCIVSFANNDILLATYNAITPGCPSVIIVKNGASLTPVVGYKVVMYAYVEQSFTGTIQGGVPVENVTLQVGWNKCEATVISETEVGNVSYSSIQASELPELVGVGIGTDESDGTYNASNWTKYIEDIDITSHMNPTPVLPIADESTSCIVAFENNDILLASYNMFTLGCPSIIIVINGADITTRIGEKIITYAYVEQSFTGTIQGGVPVDNVTLQPGWNKCEATIISAEEVGEPVCTAIQASELPELINLKTAIDGSTGAFDVTNWTKYITSF